jgi:transcriptional regulator NrdR family protein
MTPISTTTGLRCEQCGGELRVRYTRRHANAIRRRRRCVGCGLFVTTIETIQSNNRIILADIAKVSLDTSVPGSISRKG